MSSMSRLRFGAAVLCCGMVALHLAFFWLARRDALAGAADFRIFYTAALMMRRGQGDVLYVDDTQSKTQQEIAPGVVRRQGVLPYNHPPFEAALFLPFTYMTFLQGYFVWGVANLLFLSGCLFLIYPWVPRLRSMFPVIWCFAPLAFMPIATALIQGQDSILLLFLYCLTYDALRRGHSLRAGIYLGLGLFKFHLVLPFVLILLFTRRWRTLAGFLITSSVDLGVSWLMVGWRELIEYPRYVLHINALQPFHIIVPQNMPNLRGLLTGWGFTPRAPLWLEGILAAVSLAVLVWASRQWIPEDVRDIRAWDYGFSIALISTFMVGYHSYSYDMSILFLPLLLTLEHALGLRKQTHTALVYIVGIMFLSPVYLLLTLRIEHQNLFCIVLLCFAGCLALSRTRTELPASASRSTELLAAQPR